MPILVRFTCIRKVLPIKHTRKVPGFFAQKCIRSRLVPVCSKGLRDHFSVLASRSRLWTNFPLALACRKWRWVGGKYCPISRVLVCNLYKEVKDPNLIAKISCHVENSRAFSRYRDIDEEMAKEVILKLE